MTWDLVGNESTAAHLRAALAAERLPRSLLLTGPKQVGKRTLALSLARAANCSGPEPPCGACRACRLSGEGAYPDLHLIELREGRQRIGIQEIQQLQSDLARRPAEGRLRLALIVDAERLSAEAENCLLKTLEEPPPHAALVLTAEEAESLLPTTVSRCRRLRLRPVAAERIAQHLEQRLGQSAEQARLLAALADGRPGWAIAAATDPGYLAARSAALDRLARALASRQLGRLEISRTLAESWSGKSDQVRTELEVWASWWHDLLLVQVGLAERARHADRLAELREQAARYEPAAVQAALASLAQARADLDQNVNPRLALDVALLELPASNQPAGPNRSPG
jgi:DNA polymerase-3 subunit delta'